MYVYVCVCVCVCDVCQVNVRIYVCMYVCVCYYICIYYCRAKRYNMLTYMMNVKTPAFSTILECLSEQMNSEIN